MTMDAILPIIFLITHPLQLKLFQMVHARFMNSCDYLLLGGYWFIHFQENNAKFMPFMVYLVALVRPCHFVDVCQKPKFTRDWDLKDYSGGYFRKTRLQCRNNSSSLPSCNMRGKFLDMLSMSFPENKQSMIVHSVVDCESTCLIDYSCIAFSYRRNGCSVQIRDVLNVQQLKVGDSGGTTLYI